MSKNMISSASNDATVNIKNHFFLRSSASILLGKNSITQPHMYATPHKATSIYTI